jgi:hypothetical protein
MRLSCALMVGLALLTSGCTTAPMVMGISGDDSVPLNTREEVHDALGKPAVEGKVDGNPFEEFVLKGGCDEIIWGFRVPAFQYLEEFHIRENEADIRLIVASDVNSIPTKGENLIVVAAINNVLHFRLFDDRGQVVMDTDETKLPERAKPIASLKKELAIAWPPHMITVREKDGLIAAVASAIGQIPLGSFELATATVKTFGLIRVVSVPHAKGDSSRHRVLRDQALRFEYDRYGKVTKVHLNGVFLFSPTIQPDASPASVNVEFGFW